MNLTTCTSCGQHFFHTEAACPHCKTPLPRFNSRIPSAVALMMGLGMTGCGDKLQPETVALYGAEYVDTGAWTDEDGDGFYAEGDDCDDEDDSIHPYAEEIADDGVDQNCNGEDNE